MTVIISSRTSKNKDRKWYYLEWGKAAGQRVATGIFTYTKPKDQIQKNHNKEALAILETKRSQMILDRQSINSGYMPQHKIKTNFLDYYEEFVKTNRKLGNRTLENSLLQFQKFLGRDFISAIDITEQLCEQFRDYLLQHLNGETPAGYFLRFKKVMKAATKNGYFRFNPAEDIPAKSKPNKRIKEILTEQEYKVLMLTPCVNHEVKKAFIVSLYTGLRWVDVKSLIWENIKNDYIEIIQKKTGKPLEIPLHPVAMQAMGRKKTGLVFTLPTDNGAGKALRNWCAAAGLNKHITWHCARHSISVLLQRKGTDLATVAGMLGHTTIKYVQQTYKRYIKEAAEEAIQKLPSPEL